MQKLEELIAALEKAEGPSRELDCAIAVAVAGYYEIAPKWEGGPIGYGYIEDDGKRYVEPGQAPDMLVPHYTSSIDAAVTLVEQALPGWMIANIGADAVGKEYHMETIGWRVELSGGWALRESVADAPTLPLAICLATLRSKLTQEKNNAE